MTEAALKGPMVGHVHLRVADLERAIAFYRLLGFEPQARMPGAAFLGADGYHHHIGLNVWGSRGATPPPPGHTGLFHGAYLYPDRPALARAIRAVLEAGHTLTGAADHGVSEAVYLDDPDGNGVELYCDRSRDEWPRNPDGTLAMVNASLDVEALLAEAG